MEIVFFQIRAKSIQLQNFLGKLKRFYFLGETLSELNFIWSNLINNLLMLLLQSYRQKAILSNRR